MILPRSLLPLSPRRSRSIHPGAIGGIPLTCNRAEIPVLIGLAIHEPPHVEPCRCVSLTGRAGIDTLASDGNGHVITFGNDRNDFRSPAVLVRNRRRLPRATEEGHDCLAAVGAAGIVLSVFLG